MPELPEVEVIRRGLEPHITGKKIIAIHYNGKKLRTEVPIDRMQKRLCWATITHVGRRAKYLLFSTDINDLLIIHLGMTGKLFLQNGNSPLATHDHLRFVLEDGQELRFNDTRRFGSINLLEDFDLDKKKECFFAKTGPEPFSDDCNAIYLHKKAKGSGQAIKTFIMNSQILAGVGNIYANESLFASGIHPQAPAGKLSRREWQKLIDMIRKILNWAIECGGSTINDFLSSNGESGYFQANFSVYGKEGSPCTNCSTLLQRRMINGRASFFCPTCQRKKR